MAAEASKSAAVLTIKDAPSMTEEGRRHVADWLRAQADFLQENGSEYVERFRARYLYRD